ncbi:MAG: cytochrome c3 family protein [bacterium]|jgi:cytochrome b subunit of formate dehydrogenase|nr:cytochrome c3 family protein [bacterium]
MVLQLQYIFCFWLLVAGVCISPPWIAAQEVSENSSCFECHADEEMTGEVGGKEISLFVNEPLYAKSIHAELSCVDCHNDIKEFPHEDELAKVDCTQCHDDVMEEFSKSVHGVAAFERQDALAPTCASCHGKHSILPASDPNAMTYVMNIPATCGNCHKEGTEMTTTHDLDQHHVLADYSMSIHGEGIFKKGLTVSAVCTSCHGDHDILPHTHPASSIHADNVTATCMKCHAQIEKVHEKIIDGELWKTEPNKIPNCVGCHQPHKVQRVQYDIEISDETCLSCHSDPNLKMVKDGEEISLYVNKIKAQASVHGNTSCIKCHYDVKPDLYPVCKDMRPVDCSVCHAEQVQDHRTGLHGQFEAKGDPNAPSCVQCHGKHEMLAKINSASPTYPKNVPALCTQCHLDGQPVVRRDASELQGVMTSYSQSVHGKGLLESGLTVTAMCTSCHGSHKALPASDPQSAVHRDNLNSTCGVCHQGIKEIFDTSIHSPFVNKTNDPLPICEDCHSSHSIKRSDDKGFRTELAQTCGKCHERLVASYFETYHGKASKLGDDVAAKCSDCHGAHNIFPNVDPRSTLSHDNIVDTCKQCHPGSHRQFTGYLTHATHHDSEKYPILYYSFIFMSTLLIGTLTFFGLHTLLWLVRSLIYRVKNRQAIQARHRLQQQEGVYIRRFRTHQRVLHLMVIVSFLTLALTGMTLKFPDVALFSMISQWLGGPKGTGLLHRLGAIVTFTYFGIHLFLLARMWKRGEVTLMGLFTKSYSMVPNWGDAVAMWQNFKWFLGMGPRPEFGRWTYWEKFDYLAVFWGVTIIGTTGLMLWFPELFTLVLPGWIINVATIIHSDEALLATGFIFSIHFFNTHFRPSVFPMDPVIFTGRVPLEEFKEERPLEYQELVESGELEKYIVEAPEKWVSWSALVFGMLFLLTGLTIIASIIYGMLIVYPGI